MRVENEDEGMVDPQQNRPVEEADLGAEMEQLAAESEETAAETTQEDVAALRQKVEEYLDGWQRARAELANYKKRVEREATDATQRIKIQILSRYLAVLDDLERALDDRPSEGDFQAWSEGIDLIYRKMLAILENEGVSKIEAMGEFFNPTFHEALSHEESEDFPEGHVIDVIQTGYQLGELVIRPALVRVAK